MKVIDAGVVVELLVGRLDSARLGNEELAAPHLIDSEVMQVLRGLVRAGKLPVREATAALREFSDLLIDRFPAEQLLSRMWDLRDNLSAYDATYIALTEQLGATSFLTTDARLARAAGPRCPIELL